LDFTCGRFLDATVAAEGVGIGDWRSGARLTVLGRRGLIREAAAAALGVLEEGDNVREAGVTVDGP
jgi:hypothetical protein